MRKTPGVQPRILCWFGDIPPFYPCAARPATINTRSRLPCQDAVAIWSKCSPQGLKPSKAFLSGTTKVVP
jgi:hypothetical protein